MRKDRIYIYLPKEQHGKYQSLSQNGEWNDVFFSIIAIPVLTSCFSDIKKERTEGSYSIQDIVDQYNWFRSIMKSFRREKGFDLTEDEFDSLPSIELAQIVFNFSSVNGLTVFSDLVISGGSDDYDE